MSITGLIMAIQQIFNNTYCLLLPTIHAMEGRWGTLVVIVLICATTFITNFSIPGSDSDVLQVAPGRGIFLIPGIYWHKLGEGWPAIHTQYTIFPWLAVVLFGVVLGQRLQLLQQKAYPSLAMMAALMLFLFVFLRVLCFSGYVCYGNFRSELSEQNYYSFWCFTKFPPDLVYLLWSLGLNLGSLWFINRTLVLIHRKWFFTPLKVFGATSLFFYVIHFLLVALLSSPFPNGVSNPTWIYLEWVVLLYVSYPFCSLYLTFKRRKGKESWWRFL